MSDEAKLRAWWWRRQGLDGSLVGQTAAAVLAGTGWARSIGGAAPYLTLFARAALRREAIDAALANVEIHELPCARGCTYLVPSADYPLALAAGEPFAGNEVKVARKLGVTDAEIAKLRAAVVRAVAAGPLDPQSLKEKVGSAARSLGPEGVKKGLTTTLPVALGLLQSAGEIRRVPLNGRIDQQRYKYALWECAPKGSFTDLARRFFSWIGPATLTDFQTFSGLGVKAAKAAVEPLDLFAVQQDLFLLREDHDAFAAFAIPRRPQYKLVSSLDGMAHLRREASFKGHAIYDRGQLVGVWEYNTETATIAWRSFAASDKAIEHAVREMETCIREDLGDARSFSLDTPKTRAPRIAELRKAARA
jgi:hypothetical protein